MVLLTLMFVAAYSPFIVSMPPSVHLMDPPLEVLHLRLGPQPLFPASHDGTSPSLCAFSVQTLDGCEILLGPEVTYGPPGLDLFCPVAMTVAHCAEVDTENWNIQLKRKTQDSKWEVSAADTHTHTHLSSTARPDLSLAQTWRSSLPSAGKCQSSLPAAPQDAAGLGVPEPGETRDLDPVWRVIDPLTSS